MQDILQRDRSGEPVCIDEPDYHIIKAIILETKRLVQEMNTRILNCSETREYFALITGTEKNDTLNLVTPFYTDFGKNIRIGKNAVIGAGAVVTKDVPKTTVVAGNPAKKIRSL